MEQELESVLLQRPIRQIGHIYTRLLFNISEISSLLVCLVCLHTEAEEGNLSVLNILCSWHL